MKAYADRYYTTREAFYQTLQAAGIKREDYRKEVARQLASQRLYEAAVGEVVVSEDQAVRFYDTMKDMFYRTPEGFRVHMAAYDNEEEAESLRARLVSGDTWDQAVSDDKAVSRDVANITKEPVFLPVSAFSSGMFLPLASLDVGEVSPVFPLSSAGDAPASSDYAVGLKVEHVAESVRSYDDVSADIRLMLREQETRQRLAAFQNELMEKAQVVVYDTSLFPQPKAETASSDVTPEPAQSEASADKPSN